MAGPTKHRVAEALQRSISPFPKLRSLLQPMRAAPYLKVIANQISASLSTLEHCDTYDLPWRPTVMPDIFWTAIKTTA